MCPVAAKTKSPSSAPVVRKPRQKLIGRNPRRVTPTELGSPCGTSPEIVAAAMARFEAGTAEPPPAQSYDQSATITTLERGGLEQAFTHFNRELFNSALPAAVLTPRARANSYGYFSPDRFVSRDGLVRKSEIALNLDAFPERTDKWICSILAHEMIHLLQHVRGTAPKNHYHNGEWSQLMHSIGLQPTSTGVVGGKETGQLMTHMIVPGGPFEQSFNRLAQTGWKLNLQSALFRGAEGAKKKNKATYTCAGCRSNLWGKPDLDPYCGPCLRAMMEEHGIESADFDAAKMLRWSIQ